MSVYYIGNPQSELSGKYWLIYSVLVLTVSGFINGFSYKERAGLVKENYEFLKTLSGQAKALESQGKSTLDVEIAYESALNKCENHSPEDYLEALYDTYHSAQNKDHLSPHPTEYQSKQAKNNRLKRFIILFVLYALPLIITLFFNIGQISEDIKQLIVESVCK